MACYDRSPLVDTYARLGANTGPKQPFLGRKTPYPEVHFHSMVAQIAITQGRRPLYDLEQEPLVGDGCRDLSVVGQEIMSKAAVPFTLRDKA